MVAEGIRLTLTSAVDLGPLVISASVTPAAVVLAIGVTLIAINRLTGATLNDASDAIAKVLRGFRRDP